MRWLAGIVVAAAAAIAFVFWSAAGDGLDSPSAAPTEHSDNGLAPAPAPAASPGGSRQPAVAPLAEAGDQRPDPVREPAVELTGESKHAAAAQRVTVRGRVIDHFGSPVAGAEILHWHPVAGPPTVSGADGRFELAIVPFRDGEPIAARSPTHGVAVERDFGRRFLEAHVRGIAPVEVVLQFPPTPPAIRGRLRTADGQPAEGWIVGLLDPAPVFVAGLRDRQTVELQAVSPTDGAGRFELLGLIEPAYDLIAYHGQSGGVDRRPGVVVGAEVDWILPSRLVAEDVDGRVIDETGAPLAGVRIQPRVETQRLRGPTGGVTATLSLPEATSAPDGSFALERVPLRQGTLHLTPTAGEQFTPTEFEVGDLDLLAPLWLQVTRYRQVTFEVFPDELPDDGRQRSLAVGVVDGRGEAMTLRWFDDQGATGATDTVLWNHRVSSTFSVEPTAAEAVLFAHWFDYTAREMAANELARAPIQFDPQGQAHVRLELPAESSAGVDSALSIESEHR